MKEYGLFVLAIIVGLIAGKFMAKGLALAGVPIAAGDARTQNRAALAQRGVL